MELKQAQELSQEVAEILSPHCKQIMVVGSIRREKKFPKDIDIVVIPANQGALAVAINELGEPMKGGQKYLQRRYKGQQVDIYIANENTWPTLVLIRTGSKEHNIKLCSQAKKLNGHLHADGSGLEINGKMMPVGDEKDIFAYLRIPYAEPSKRAG